MVRTASPTFLEVSLSHASGVVAAATSGAGPIGVDVEAVAATGFAGFDEVALHVDERPSSAADRARAWTRKEALLKATGQGLTLDPRRVRIGGTGPHPRLLDWPAAPLDPPSWFTDIITAEGYAGCVVLLAAEPVAVRVRQEPMPA